MEIIVGKIRSKNLILEIYSFSHTLCKVQRAFHSTNKSMRTMLIANYKIMKNIFSQTLDVVRINSLSQLMQDTSVFNRPISVDVPIKLSAIRDCTQNLPFTISKLTILNQKQTFAELNGNPLKIKVVNCLLNNLTFFQQAFNPKLQSITIDFQIFKQLPIIFKKPTKTAIVDTLRIKFTEGWIHEDIYNSFTYLFQVMQPKTSLIIDGSLKLCSNETFTDKAKNIKSLNSIHIIVSKLKVKHFKLKVCYIHP